MTRGISQEQQENDELIQLRKMAIAKDVQNLMSLLRDRARYVSRTLAWEYVAMGVAEIQELARCTSDLAKELQLPPAQNDDAIDLVRVLAQMQTLLRTIAGPDLAINYLIPIGEVRVRMYGSSVEQALINLVSNARKAGAKTVQVTLFLDPATRGESVSESTTRNARIEVVDDGSGLPAEFTSAQSDRGSFTTAPKWYGDGLKTVFDIAREAGGHFVIANQEQGGAIARVTVPALGQSFIRESIARIS
ncbi:MAG: ATP-binding protein [Pseudomonadota bacterium]